MALGDRKEVNAFDLYKFENTDEVQDLGSEKITNVSKEEFLEIDSIEDLEDNEETKIQEEEVKEEETSETEIEEGSTNTDIVETPEDDAQAETFEALAEYLIEEGVIIPKDNKDYFKSPEGIRELVKDSIEIGIDEYKASKPKMAQDFIEFIENDGDPRDFIQQVSNVNYRDVVIVPTEEDEDNLEEYINTQKLVIRDKLVLDGLTEEEIEDTISGFEEAKQLEKQAKFALKNLIKIQDEEYTSMLKEQEEFKQSRIKEAQVQEEDLKKLIKGTKKIGDYDLTDSDQDNFIKYLTVPVQKDKQGNILTKALVDSQDPVKRLELAYLQFKGGIKELTKKAENKTKLQLKEKLSNFNKQDKNTKVSTDTFENAPKRETIRIKLPEWLA